MVEARDREHECEYTNRRMKTRASVVFALSLIPHAEFDVFTR
jgi:hypothetical protein